MKVKGLVVLAVLLLSGCGTNHNDVMVAYYTAMGGIKAAEVGASVKIAEQETAQVQALVNAEQGGTRITVPETGQVIEVTNPNAYYYNRDTGNAFAVSERARGGLPGTSVPTGLRAPVKRESWWQKAGGFTLGILGKTIDTALANAVPVFSVIEQNKTQRALAEYQYASDREMFATFGGFGDNMESVATTATGDMRVLGESGFGQMQILGSNYADAMATSHGYGMAAIRDVTETAFENPLTNVVIETSTESSSSSFSESVNVPDWVQDIFENGDEVIIPGDE